MHVAYQKIMTISRANGIIKIFSKIISVCLVSSLTFSQILLCLIFSSEWKICQDFDFSHNRGTYLWKLRYSNSYHCPGSIDTKKKKSTSLVIINDHTLITKNFGRCQFRTKVDLSEIKMSEIFRHPTSLFQVSTLCSICPKFMCSEI